MLFYLQMTLEWTSFEEHLQTSSDFRRSADKRRKRRSAKTAKTASRHMVDFPVHYTGWFMGIPLLHYDNPQYNYNSIVSPLENHQSIIQSTTIG